MDDSKSKSSVSRVFSSTEVSSSCIAYLLSAQQQPLKLMQVCQKAYEAFTPFVVQLPAQNVIAALLNVIDGIPQAQLTSVSAYVIDHAESIIAVSEVLSNLTDLAIAYPKALSLVRLGLWFEHAGCVPIYSS